MNIKNEPQKQRFILVKVADLTLVFPIEIISEIGIIESEQIINLPFYDRSVMGCIYYGGKMVTVLSMLEILGQDSYFNRDKIILVCLNENAQDFQGIGLAADKVLGTATAQDLPPELFTGNVKNMKLFKLELLNQQMWELQRYSPELINN